MSEYSDKELLDLFRNGSNANYAFNLIVQKHQRKLYHVIRRLVIDHDDTNDLLQNTFIKAWTNLGTFREESILSTWLYRIASNEALTFITSKRKKVTQSLENIQPFTSHQDSTTGSEIQEKLLKAIHTLPEKQRIVFNMKYYDELKYEEMSEILDTSVGALKASYHHAVKKIEEFITKD
jgi:RNA polymerase sigma factor (sigma-70 family)